MNARETVAPRGIMTLEDASLAAGTGLVSSYGTDAQGRAWVGFGERRVGGMADVVARLPASALTVGQCREWAGWPTAPRGLPITCTDVRMGL